MRARSGPFWDGVEGRAPVPPAAATLGFEFVDADVEAGTIEVAFTATEAFVNPAGNVLGAFLAAMLYDTVGPALLATLGPDRFQSTLQLSVSFLRPVRPGRLTGKGRIVHRDGTRCSWKPPCSTATRRSSPPPPRPPRSSRAPAPRPRP